MKEFKNYILLFSSLLMAMPLAAQDCKSLKLAAEKIQVSHVEMSHHNDLITVMMNLNLDSLDLPTNNQLVYTPIIKHKGELLKMPEIVINGRRQQIMYDRGVGKKQLQLSPQAFVG